ncbi:MAG: 50S ribosomal protein L17 [Opitutaceae bacterium]
MTREHREAMLSNLAASLIVHGRIRTTLTKARALRPFVEKIITKAKRAGAAPGPRALHLRRLALRDVRDEDAVTLLFNEKYKEFQNRPGGYTRIYKLGPQRISDAAELALVEFVKADEPGYKKRGRKAASGKTGRKPGSAKAAKAAGAAAETGAASAPAEEAAAGSRPESIPASERPKASPAPGAAPSSHTGAAVPAVGEQPAPASTPESGEKPGSKA